MKGFTLDAGTVARIVSERVRCGRAWRPVLPDPEGSARLVDVTCGVDTGICLEHAAWSFALGLTPPVGTV